MVLWTKEFSWLCLSFLLIHSASFQALFEINDLLIFYFTSKIIFFFTEMEQDSKRFQKYGGYTPIQYVVNTILWVIE